MLNLLPCSSIDWTTVFSIGPRRPDLIEVFQAPRQVEGLVISDSAVARLRQIGGKTGALRSGWHVGKEEEESFVNYWVLKL